LKKILALTLACCVLVLASVDASAQTRRRSTTKRTVVPKTSFEEKQQAEIRAGREQIAAQIKALTQFLYLFGNIAKGIETAEQVSRNNEQTSVGMSAERLAQSKAKLKDSIKTVRLGLNQLESNFRLNPVLQSYYPKLAGVAKLGQTAESQAAASTFDQAGRSLLAAVNKLADALVALR